MSLTPKVIIEDWWRVFISLRLTFILLLIMGIGSILGMSFDQTKSFLEYTENIQNTFSAKLVSAFELFDAFHSWWFSLCIVLLALNLIACSIERLPRIYFDVKRPRPYLTKRRQLGLKYIEHIFVPTKEEAKILVKKFLPHSHKKCHLMLPDYYYTERHMLGRFGVYIVHTALLIIMFSSIYATQNGVSGHVLIPEGEQKRQIIARGASGIEYPYDLGFYIGCSDFRLKTFINNSPMEYESDLYIALKDQPIIKKTVRVNDPLTYAGFTFYQSSYIPVVSDPIISIDIQGNSYKESKQVRLHQPIKIINGEIISVEKFYDDFAGLGQALMLEQKKLDGSNTYFHIFRRYPDYDRIVRDDNFSVIFLGVDGLFVTGLSVGYVPGISVILTGFVLLLFGLYLCFFVYPMRFFAQIEPKSSGFLVSLAAQGFRQQQVVMAIFQKQLLEIKS